MPTPIQPTVFGIGTRTTVSHNFTNGPLVRVAHAYDPGVEVDGLYTTVFVLTYDTTHATEVNQAIVNLEDSLEAAVNYHSGNNAYSVPYFLHAQFADEFLVKVALIHSYEIKQQPPTTTSDPTFDMAPTATFAVAITRYVWENKTDVTLYPPDVTINSNDWLVTTIRGTLPGRIWRVKWNNGSGVNGKHTTITMRHAPHGAVQVVSQVLNIGGWYAVAGTDTAISASAPYYMETTFATDETDIVRAWHWLTMGTGNMEEMQGDWDLRMICKSSDTSSIYAVTPYICWTPSPDSTASNVPQLKPLSTVIVQGTTNKVQSAGTVSLPGIHKYLTENPDTNLIRPILFWKAKRISGTGTLRVRGIATLSTERYVTYDHSSVDNTTALKVFTTPEGEVMAVHNDPLFGITPNEMPQITAYNWAMPQGGYPRLAIFMTDANDGLIEATSKMAKNVEFTYFPRWRNYAES